MASARQNPMASGEEQHNGDRVPVFLRLCPNPGGDRAVEVIDERTIKVAGEPAHCQRLGAFEYVFAESTSQEHVFRTSTLPLLEGLLLNGENALLLAYGASGSGKTHTVSGREKSPGLLPMAFGFLFNHLDRCSKLSEFRPRNFDEVTHEAKTLTALQTDSCGVWVSVLQIYNEVLTDLLNEAPHKPLSIAQDSQGRCFVRDAKWLAVKSNDEALRLLREARRRQNVTSTKLNDSSSRSHFAVFVKVLRKAQDGVKVNQAVVVDLAGTERQAATGSSGTILRQAGFINSSLLVLRRCIDALRKGHQQIPFRDSKLTRLLSPFLTAAQTRLALIVCISACRERLSDSLTSIKFAVTASDLLHPQELVKRIRETRRRSGEILAMKSSLVKPDTVELPAKLHEEMQADLKMAEKLAVENEDLRRRLQLLEESAENAKLMYIDKTSALRREQRAAMKALKEEQEALRHSIQAELLEEIEEILEKNKKYKKQGRTMAALIRERLYPELELFRNRYGHMDDFPPLEKEDIRAFEPPDEEVEACTRCKTLEENLNESSRKLQNQIHLHERVVEQLRSERELRVLLQEKTRLPFLTDERSGQSSWMELTCQAKVKVTRSLGSGLDGHSTASGDSGNETAESREEKLSPEDDALNQLQEEKRRLHESLVQHMRLLDQKDFILEESEARIRDLEEKYEEAGAKLQSTQVLLERAEASRAQLEQRLAMAPCQLGCDRCLRSSRLQEIPRTAPSSKRAISPSMVRESALTFTPVFCSKGRYKKDLARRRLRGASSSDDDCVA